MEQAFQSIEAARDYIRKHSLNKNLDSDLVVHLRGGRYEVAKTLEFDGKDSGSNTHRVIYQKYRDESPVLCGGVRITGWKKVDGQAYYEADATAALKRAGYFRQLYVDGIRSLQARSHTYVKNTHKKFWDDPSTPERYDGVWLPKRDYKNIEDLQLFYAKVFKVGYMHVDSILPAENDDEMIVKMEQPDFQYWASWDNARATPTMEFRVLNAMEELDEPGEWYVNRKTKKIYYYPTTPAQDMSKVETWAPATEFLLKVKGDAKSKASDLSFKGLTFRYGNWMAPETMMLGRTQAEIFDKYKSEIPGQIILDHTDRVTIRDCRVVHQASVGVQLYEDCDDTLIEGNVFYDLTAAGVSIGRWYHNKKECPAENICRNTMVRNNIVRSTGRDYDQGTGLNVFIAYDCKFHHNDVSDTSYTAIHARIGDSGHVRDDMGKIEFKFNKVSRAQVAGRYGMDDGGHLYLHGRYPGSVVEGNYSRFHSTKGHGWEFYSDNWSHTIHWLNNVSRDSIHPKPVCWNWHGGSKGVVYENTWAEKSNLVGKKTAGRAKLINYVQVKDGQWPDEAVAVMENAGLQPAYRHLLNSIYGHESLTENKPAWASSSLSSKHGAETAFDRDWDTFWHTKSGGDGAGWLAVDLGKKFVIQRLEILPRQNMFQDHTRKNFVIEGSNDRDFKKPTVLVARNDVTWYHGTQRHPSNLFEWYLKPKQGFRFLRVRALNDAGSFNLAEFNVYGYLAQ
ncbi:discoidin domain-containing protein [Verrucomicrobiaceae bacterium N1E253]|uniref:Discoidin domain-containing protein n=1 Tax=Oceaniferula marina TaxID=2748318 RepID=A0A851GP06_9BACT|nr:discoidin domain-containing protein [Oceaniferula marina]NWK56560.1 discoidin domain-containing protein [Oceaniferula marina]